MAMPPVNDRDLILYQTSVRITGNTGKTLLITASSPVFQVNNAGAGSPSQIIFNAIPLNITGTASFTASAGTLTANGTNSNILTFANATANTITVTATVTDPSTSISYSASITVNKVFDGTIGLQNAIAYAYQRSATTVTSNPGDVLYQFSSASITTATLLNGWLKTIPSGTDPLYVTAASASSNTPTDPILAAEWSAPVVLAVNGTIGSNGFNSATVYIYQRVSTNSAPALPSVATTYTFSPSGLAGLNNGWSTTIPAYASGTYLFAATATAVATTATASIPSTGWSTAQLLTLDGLNAPLLFLTSTAQSITYNGLNVATPSPQTISFTANLQNVTGTATFVATLYDVNGTVIGTPTMGGTGNTATLTDTQFGAAVYCKVVATLSSLTDTMTIVKLKDGSTVLAGYLTNEDVTVATASDGSGGNYGNAAGTFKVFFGTTDVTASATFSIVGVPVVTTTAPTAGTGAFSVTGAGTWANASSVTSVTYRATYSGGTIDKVFTLAKSFAGATGPQGNSITGPAGSRGTINISASGYSAWSDAAAVSAISAAGYGAPQDRDQVTLYNGTFSQTRFYTVSGAVWTIVTAYINGNLLVDGTIAAAKIVASSITAAQIQAGTITATQILAGSITADRLNIGNGINLVPNSGPKIAAKGWYKGGNVAPGSNPILSFNDPSYQYLYAPSGLGCLSAYVPSPVAADIGTVLDIYTDLFTVSPSTRYEVSAYLSMHRAVGSVYLLYYDSSGAGITPSNSVVSSSITDNQYSYGNDINVWEAGARTSAFFTVPSTCYKVRFVFRMTIDRATTGGAYMFMSGPMMAVAKLNQTTFSPYNSSGGGTVIDAGGIVTNNLSAISATIGTLTSSAAFPKTVITDGQISVYDSIGNLRVRIGNY